MTYRYTVYGLVIDSPFEFPELIAVDALPDIFVRFGYVPPSWETPDHSADWYQVKNGQFIISIEPSSRMLVRDGKEIWIEKSMVGAEHAIRPHILGSGLGAILHQRGMLPIHASSIRIGDDCILFAGKRGYGKSTLALEFIRRGYLLHADDLCVISSHSGLPFVYPGYPQLKLWEDTMDRTGISPGNYQAVPSFPNKYAVPITPFNKSPLPIRAIYFLKPEDRADTYIEPVHGTKKFRLIKNHIFRRGFLNLLDADRELFAIIGALSKKVKIFQVHRQQELCQLENLVKAIEENVASIASAT